MRIDAANIAPGAELTADVAIVGAGPAGIVLARELSASRLNVLLLESGRETFDARIQALGDAELADEHHVATELATRRQLGGASNTWGGRCVPFDQVDFEKRDVTGGIAWPVTYDELARYFAGACDWLRCGRPVFSARELPELADRALVPGLRDSDVLASSLERWSLPTNFAREYGRALAGDPRIRLVLGATCVRVNCDEGGRPSGLAFRSLNGSAFSARASRYVLAAGGLESTRLLMISSEAGLGNQSGHLGRWYMAHSECRLGHVRFSTPPEATIFGHERDADGVYVRRRFTFSREAQRRHGLPNTAIWLANPKISDPRHGSAVLSFVYLALASPLGRFAVAEGIRQAHLAGRRDEARRHWRNVLSHPLGAAAFAIRFGYDRYLRRGRKVPGFFIRSASNTYPLVYHAEHLPSYDSHVRLSDERDALGVPRLETHLAFREEEAEAAVRAHEQLDDHLRTCGVGRVEITEPEPAASAMRQFFGGYHQSGTTRMSTDPKDGVVDPNLAVHGTDNLFVASSSTFPTSSQANSTFTIIVFTLRLAQHLRSRA
jgi:choline dehydrogenase-like flavoprotein